MSLEQLFCTYGLGLYFFWQKEIGSKAARKMLVKLTAGRLTRISVSVERSLIDVRTSGQEIFVVDDQQL